MTLDRHPAVREVPLSRGMTALVDDGDYEMVSAFRWCAHISRHTWYAQRSIRPNGKRASVKMHRLILAAPPGMVVDHINGNGLDNRRCNIRLCTAQENNRHRVNRRTSSSPYRGVHWHKAARKWSAIINVDGMQWHLGLFVDATDAAKVYDETARREFGEFAVLNFTDSGGPA